jgi:hypothetical protein
MCRKMQRCRYEHQISLFGLVRVSSSPQWPRGLRRWDRGFEILPGGMDVCLLRVCVLLGRGLCDGPIPRPEESYRLWCVSECDQEKKKNIDTYCD